MAEGVLGFTARCSPGTPAVCRVVRVGVGWVGIHREGPGGARPPYTGPGHCLDT